MVKGQIKKTVKFKICLNNGGNRIKLQFNDI